MGLDRNSRLSLYCGLFLFSLVLGACTQKEQESFNVIQGSAQGSSFKIKYPGDSAKDGLKENIDSLLDRVDRTFSMYIDSSGVLDFQKAEKGICMDPLFEELFPITQEVHERTEGAFDPTVKPLVDAWGFGPDGRPEKAPDRIDSLLELVGLGKLQMTETDSCSPFLQKSNPRLSFDPNAVAQGFTVDLILRMMKEEYGIGTAMVEVGGEVRVMSGKDEKGGWRIGVEDPKGPDEERSLNAVAELKDRSIATSGSYRKFYEKDGKRYPHTIDPRDGKPVEHQLLSVTVIHPSCARADAYATAFMVLGAERATRITQEDEALEAYFIMADGEEEYKTFATKGFEETLRAN